MGRHLTTDLLRLAYREGYFPMPEPGSQEILWYRPDPRAIIPLASFSPSRSLKRSMKNRGYRCSIDQDFCGVIAGCASRSETWINEEFHRAYTQLHREGDAHSVEVWLGDRLVGGVYGVAVNGAFFAESKFHTERDASKVALAFLIEHLLQRQMSLLEVQFLTPHLKRLGAVEVSSAEYDVLLLMALRSSARFL